ncbi:hypothetical protein WMF31_36585 [Sorangium sp. So ce1036]|uniref:hypothetical protein n=1 Tax=Sorangium sp. So ce1036 TaxID=3133328 RepID=UPI003F04AAC0
MGAVLVGLALLGVAAPVAASEPEELFTKGMAELQAGRYGTACPALRKSYRLDRQPRTLFYLAECAERAGRIATAAVHYDEYLDKFDGLSPPEQEQEADRRKLALERRQKLDADIPRVKFRLPDGAPSGTKVTRTSASSPDPVPVKLGVELPIDPGEHWVRSEPPGGPRRDQRFFVNKKERLTIELTVANPGEATPWPTPIDSTPTVSAPTAASQLPPDMGEGSSLRRPVAYISGGVGLAGLVTGIVTGAITWGQKKTISENCNDNNFCNRRGQEAADLAAVASPISTVSFGIGVAGLGISAFLFLTEPETVRVQQGAPRSQVASRPDVKLILDQREAAVQARWVW